MACASSTIKYLLFTFNLIFALGGLTILILGAIIQWNLDFYDQFFGESIAVPSILLIVVGSIIFVISFFGCYGAIRESQCMLISFSICMSILFVVQLVGAILAFVYVASVDDLLYKAMKQSMTLYNSGGSEGDLSKQAWDAIQKDWNCCGVDNYLDWRIPTEAGGPGMENPPSSCKCKNSFGSCAEAEGYYADGCYDDMVDFVRVMQYAMGGVALGVAVIELVGVFFACCLASSLKAQKKRRTV